MLTLYITGVQSGETITGIGKQCLGTRMEVRGSFPASQEAILKLTPELIRDELNQYARFQKLSVPERFEQLCSNLTTADLYLEDVELQVRFLSVSGDYFRQLWCFRKSAKL